MGLLLALAASGAALAVAPDPTVTVWRVVAAFHALAAGALLLAIVALVARALLAMRGSNAERAPWILLVVALGCALALHATGSALAPGERGAEGLAHAAAALAPLPPPSPALVLATHALALPLLLLCALALAAGLPAHLLRRPRDPRVARLSRAELVPALRAGAATVALVALVTFALPVSEPVPEIRSIEAARAPWPLLALEPLESSIGVPLALAVLLVALLALALVPMLAPPRYARRLALVLAAGYLALTLAAGLAPPATHLASGVGL